MGQSLGNGFHCNLGSSVLGDGAGEECGPASARSIGAERSMGGKQAVGGRSANSAGDSLGQAGGGFRHMADALGADQSVSAAYGRYRAALQRRRTERPSAFYLISLGISGLLW